MFHALRSDGKSVDNDDIHFHFALTTGDFECAVVHFKHHGVDESLPHGHPSRLIPKRAGLAGFPQVCLIGPGCNIIKINAVPFNSA